MTSRFRALLLASAGALLFSCAAALTKKVGMSPEVSTFERSPKPAGSVTAERSGSGGAGVAVDWVSKFEPLRATPDYRSVREALEVGEIEKAALLASELAEKDERDRGGRHFYAAVLGGEAGRSDLAKTHFAAVLGSGSVLEEESRLRLVEVALLGRDYELAARELEKLTTLASSERGRLASARLALAMSAPGEIRVALANLGNAKSPAFSREALFSIAARLDAVAAADSARELGALALEVSGQALLGLAEKSSEEVRIFRLRKDLGLKLGSVPPGRTRDDWLVHLRLREAEQDYDGILEQLPDVGLPKTGELDGTGCEIVVVSGRAYAGLRKWGEAYEALAPRLSACEKIPETHAKMLFNAGKYAGADGREAKASSLFAELEKRYPENSLADDARVRRAQSALDSGSIAQFTELLLKIPDDYPNGDMTMEGVFLLALHRIERRDWAGAALILERGKDVVASRDVARGQEFSGTERYFLARAKGELGDSASELAGYEEIVRNYPLSYYMLHAYSRLREVAPERAKGALEAGRKRATENPFVFPTLEPKSRANFERGLELLRVGALAEGEATVRSELGDASGSALWALARIFERAGDSRVAHDIARRKLSDWLLQYPEADWREPWEIGFPRPHLPLVEKASLETRVPAWFIYGIMREESLFDERAESPARAYGLMQLIEPTARNIGRKEGIPYDRRSLLSPRNNIALGARVLRNLGKQFVLNPWLAIPGYNAGPGRPVEWLKKRPDLDFDVWVELIPFRETRRYTKRVLASRAAYALLYHPESADEALVLPRSLRLPE